MKKPPEWYRKIGKYGIWVSLAVSVMSLIFSIIVLLKPWA